VGVDAGQVGHRKPVWSGGSGGGDVDEPDVAGVGLADAIEALRADLVTAIRKGAAQPVQFPIAKLTVELQVVATRSADGKAGFKVPVVSVELGGSGRWQRENAQKITVEFGAPVDHEGRPVKVASASDEAKG
jgi:hypothetical protein